MLTSRAMLLFILYNVYTVDTKSTQCDVIIERIRSKFHSLAFWYCNLKNEIQIWSQMRTTLIIHLKPILNISKFRIEIQIEMKFHIFLRIQQLRQIMTLQCTLKCGRDCWTHPKMAILQFLCALLLMATGTRPRSSSWSSSTSGHRSHPQQCKPRPNH